MEPISLIEFGVPVWNTGLTKGEAVEIERVQKAFIHIALGAEYKGYREALVEADLETLESRRVQLCSTFARKSAKHSKHENWFKLNEGGPDTRSAKAEYKVPLHRLARYRDSPIP